MRRGSVALVVLAVLAAAAAAVAGPATPRAERAVPAEAAGLTPLQERLRSGVWAAGATSRTVPQAPAIPQRRAGAASTGTDGRGCPLDSGAETRVNRECQNVADPDLLGRSQAQNEPAIAHDPANPRRLVASSNDYRRGDGNCYAYTSADGGRTWRDSTVPMSFTRGTAFGGADRQYWQAGGDTSVAWDTRGNVYLSCLMFNRGTVVSANPDASSAFYVLRSTGSRGATWNFPARPVAELNDMPGEGAALLDKQYMTVDNHPDSPFRDRVYVTWTAFAADGTAYIYGAYSSDYAESFSAPTLISAGTDVCRDTFGLPTPEGPCNVNQFSQPFTGSDGSLYVVFNNYNVTGSTPSDPDNRAQVLLAKSDDGGASFSAPVKVSDYYDAPDCASYQGGASAGVGCFPESGPTKNSIFRAANYASGAVDPGDPDRLVVALGSYINRHSNENNGCVPGGFSPQTFLPLYDGVKTPGACNNDIVISRSDDGGATFTGGSTDVRELPAARSGDPRFGDQFFQWAAFDREGRFGVAYYDRGYGDDQATGYSDVSLAGTRDTTDFAEARVTTTPMPPATQFAGGFFGDYIGLTAGTVAHPIWADTRADALTACRGPDGAVTLPPAVCTADAPNAPVANDQNLLTATLTIPAPGSERRARRQGRAGP